MNEKPIQKEHMTTKLTEPIDRSQISELLSRYCNIVDAKCISATTVAAFFTPNGAAVVGPEAIAAEKAKSFNRFKATQHVTSDYVIDLKGDTAQLRANMIAMHLWTDEESDPRSLQTHYVAGGVLEAVAVRTAEGWRFSELKSRITWRTGAGMYAVYRMGKLSD